MAKTTKKAAEKEQSTIFDIEKIKADIAAEEAALEEKRKAIRDKQLEPVKEAIQKLQAERRDIDEKLNELNAIEAELEGRSLSKSIRSGGTGKRRRLKEEQKLELAKGIFTYLSKSKGNRHARKDLESYSDGVAPAALIELWNEKGAENNGQKIHIEGKKSLTRYFLPV